MPVNEVANPLSASPLSSRTAARSSAVAGSGSSLLRRERVTVSTGLAACAGLI